MPFTPYYPGGGRSASSLLARAKHELSSRNFSSAKHLVEQALALDPLVPFADEILAVADVILNSSSASPHAVLQIPLSASPADVTRSYRRLALLLDTARNPNPHADEALRLVTDAFSSISNPSNAPFWTACHSCCNLHLFDREYVGCFIRCSTCGRAFKADELSKPPAVIPGKDMYYCSWGFFPLGYPGGPQFKGGDGLNGFCSNLKEKGGKSGAGVRTKTLARKNVCGGLRKPIQAMKSKRSDDRGVENRNVEVGGVGVSDEVKGCVDGDGGVDGNGGSDLVYIDSETTDDDW